ncbi:threonine--tRNA ligase [Candidatus Pelagisphaera phototrophica]|uniref:threonine--tRNA ligase n=1 Tax=Candidatus Pelagisphaera phototrophica TaxID=2684113 RepID=UPI001A07A539|nr:threonine--tRNA ligase [Candidatus Pelagisphaera phototrophica]QXD30875.1 threonine--tRNA ligase [Candidatus Pelagisphaera phototrophica]
MKAQMTPLEEIRHSSSHVLATAVLRLFPDAKLDIGPPTDTGFYYDFDLEHKFTAEDLEKIEAAMKKVIKENQKFERIEVSREEAVTMITDFGQTEYKLSRLRDIPEGEQVSFYRNGEFLDLCAGTHVNYTKKIKAFKLLSVAGAYHRGDSNNKQLQRIYGTAFQSKDELAEYLEMLEEAKKRDHRRLGKEMQLFTFDSEHVGPGLPLWMPKGTELVEELEKLAKETEFEAGYDRVRTPHIAKESLYLTSGHLPYYEESMFPAMEFEEETGGEKVRYFLKAMNCPHHHKIYAAVPRSYRDLPLRLAEYGTCYRYEQSGELMGLMRVRSMQMNDAHIYCTAEQFEAEFNAVNEMYLKYFKLFGFEKYLMRFSTHDPDKLGKKFVDNPELWLKTENMVRDVLQASGINYVEVPNEAAFYGPKIDVQVWSAIGREFTIATNQVDFAVPARFGLEYTTSENKKETPLCIHRAPLGTHERFIGFLIEHFGGDFPTWLAPEQVRVLPISDKIADYAQSILADLKAAGVRATADLHAEKLGAKIRKAELEKVPNVLIVGASEAEEGNVSVRSRFEGNRGSMSREAFLTDLLEAIQVRKLQIKE